MRVLVLLALAALLVPAAARAGGWKEEPVVPSLGAGVGAHVREIARRGAALGVRRDFVAKLGDSITASSAFLVPLACSAPVWGGWSELTGTVSYFGRDPAPGETTAACGTVNSFSRTSAAAVRGWTLDDALRPKSHPPQGCTDEPAVRCELELLHPSVALIMFGTNDVAKTREGPFRRRLAHVAELAEGAGTIPVISTIPPRLSSPRLRAKTERFDAEIGALAANRRLPLWNYWRQMSAPRIPRHGIGPDGVHPSLCSSCSAINFTPSGLRQGYALRNLGALRVLDRLRQQVLEPGG